MPTKGWLTSAFMRERIHPILHLARPHEGIDVTATMGADIEAPAAGIVAGGGGGGGPGHNGPKGHGLRLAARSAHFSKILAVRGQRVQRGEGVGEGCRGG